MKKKEKKEIRINLWIIIILLMVSTVGMIFLAQSRNNKLSLNLSLENKRAMTYEQYKQGDEAVDGTNNVKFNAFFLRDLDEDGEAETIYGSCKEIGEKDTLYMEVIVQTAGELKDAKIQIDGKNFNLQTALPKDSQLKNSYIGDDIKQIEFNNLKNGTQKLLAGIVKSGINSKNSAIDGNINNYSRNDNKVILTGTYVPEEGNPIQIRKEIDLTMDWYGTTKAKVYTGKDFNSGEQTYEDIQKRVDEENDKVILDCYINTSEQNNQLYLSKNYVEATIPELNGYAPIEVKETTNSCTYTFDNDSKKLIMEKNATADETGKITKTISKNNQYKVQVTYPIEAYKTIGEDSITIKIPVETYYEGFNNNSEEFENPYKSNIAKDTIVANYTNPKGKAALFKVTVGKYINSPTIHYMISKQKPLKIYNSISSEEKDDKYTVLWSAYTGSDGETSGMTVKETKDGETKKTDSFIKTDSSEESIEEITTNIGIYFTGAGSMLKEDGWIKVYNEENNELIETFTKENWNKYTAENPYIYEEPVKHIRIETSETNKESTLKVYNIKELNDNIITTKYTKEKFDELKYIKSNLAGYLGDSFVNTDTHQAVYEAPFSMTKINISNNEISTQETCKDFEIEIEAIEDSEKNQVGWHNGQFLVKIPDEILATEINRVYIKELETSVISYELIENENGKFIKVNTKNASPKSFTIVVNVNITPDPRISTMSRSFELYAYNEETCDYYNETKDIYDVNNNSNTNEKVNKSSTSISFIAPNSLITHQTASEFDEKHTVLIAPQIAELKPIKENDNIEKSTVKIGIELNNNYANTISDVIVLGKIPFEGNTYVLSGGDLKSKFSTTMKNTGIEIPEELEGKVTIYYSEQENPTKEIEKSENGWKTKQNVTDWSKIKTFLIDFGDNKLVKGAGYTFSYTVEIPYGVECNKVAYSHHGVYFSLDTDNGKYRTQTEPNKIGIRSAEKYQLEINKYQVDKEKLVAGATYKVTYLDDEGKEESKTAVTNAQGKILMANLYVEKEYQIEEIASPESYELNNDVIKIIGHKDENGTLNIEKISGNTKGNIRVEKEDNKEYKAIINVEDEVKASISITKTEQGTNQKLQNVEFEIEGKEVNKTVVTDKDGKISLNGFYLNEEYTLKELKAIGHYIITPIKFKIVKNNTQYAINILEGSVKNTTLTFNDEIPNFNLEIENEKIPTYNLKVVKEAEDGKKLSDARFIIKGSDENFQTARISNQDGEFDVEGLYQYVEGKYITGEYTISEIKSPNGYVSNNEEIKFVVSKNQSNELEVNVENRDNLSTFKDATVDGNMVTITITNKPLFKLIKTDKETGAPLANAKFVIYEVDDDGNEIGFAKDINENYVGTLNDKNKYEVVTNENGEITIPLKNGTYKAIEIEAPIGYEKSQSEEIFKISGNEENEDVGTPDEYTNTLEINYIEDLVDLSENVRNGNTYSGTKVILKRTLDFTENNSYREPSNKTTYGDYNLDGNIEDIKTELTTGTGFRGIGISPYSGYNQQERFFSGIFDGQGNEINGIHIDYTAEAPANVGENKLINFDNAALFSNVQDAKIKRLSISGNITGENNTCGLISDSKNTEVYSCCNNCYIKGTSECAGIIGSSTNDRVENCINNGKIESTLYYGGGIVAHIGSGDGTTVKNCYNYGDLDFGGNYCGGIVGRIDTGSKNIENCANYGNLTFSGNQSGGILGRTSCSFNIINCMNYGNIIASKSCDNIGGIAGELYGANIIQSINYGNIQGQISRAGGIVGYSATKVEKCINYGDVIGEENSTNLAGIGGEYISTCSECANYGDVIGKSYISGITRNATIKNCYNRGDLYCSDSYVGGISPNGEVTNSYSTGKIYNITKNESGKISNVYTIGTNTNTTNSYYLYSIDDINADSKFNTGTQVTKEELQSRELFERLNVDDVWLYREGEAPLLKIPTSNAKIVSELKLTNEKQYFKITTDVELTDGVKGGSISGEDEVPYESVKYNENSTKQIKVEPDDGFEIISITINGKSHDFEPASDGTYTLSLFRNMLEDKMIVVKFQKNDQVFKINKVDTETNEPLKGAEFNIAPKGQDITNKLTKNNQYYFAYDSETKQYKSDNSAAGVNNTTANSLIPINSIINGVTGRYKVVINASVSSEENKDIGWATLKRNGPNYDNTEGRFIYISGEKEAQDYESEVFEYTTAENYFVILGYTKNGNIDYGEDSFKINSVKLINIDNNEETDVTSSIAQYSQYDFKLYDGSYIPTNGKKYRINNVTDLNNTFAHSYIELKSPTYIGKYYLEVDASISSEKGKDIGYATISNDKTIEHGNNDSIIEFMNISGEKDRQIYKSEPFVLDDYQNFCHYINFVYSKDDANNVGDDSFTIHSIRLCKYDDLQKVTTDSNGKASFSVDFAKQYTIDEIKAPNGYILNPERIEFNPSTSTDNTLIVKNSKTPKIFVNHYLWTTSAGPTETKVADSEEYIGNNGDNYETRPNVEIRYDIITNKDYFGDKTEQEILNMYGKSSFEELGYDSLEQFYEDYYIPSNSSGKYTDKNQTINYYYKEEKIPLIVHHYIEGTTTPVPLANGENAQDENLSGYKEESYTTSQIENSKLSVEYELVEKPSNSEGTYAEEGIEVTYFYKKVQRKLNLIKYAEDGTTPLPGAKFSIKNNKDNSVLGEYTTNNNGKITLDLEAGTYTIKETQAPSTYKLDETEKTIEIKRDTTTANINITNEKIKGTVTVHYYVEGTITPIKLKDGKNAKDVINTGVVGEIYSTKPEENAAEYYELVNENPEHASGEYIDGNIDVIYYYTLKDYGYRVEYYYDGVIDNLKTESNTAKYGEKIENYTDKVIDGYVFDKTEGLPLTISTDTSKNVIKVYYVRKAGLSYTVNYLEKGTNKVLKTAKVVNNKAFNDVIRAENEVEPISKYNYDSSDKDTLTIGLDNSKNVINLYYTKKDASLVVKYIDEITEKEISTRDTITGKVDDKYTTKAKEISGYVLTGDNEKTSGELKEEEIIVIYYYKYESAGVVVNHLDVKTNKEIADSEMMDGQEGDDYETKEKEIEGYELVTERYPENAKGEMKKEVTTVNYYYVKKTKVTAKYIDKNTNKEIADPEMIDGHEGDNYNTEVKNIPGYVLVEEPRNKKGTMTAEPIELTYYYVQISAGVIEKHIDEFTNELLGSKTYQGNEGDSYKTSSRKFEGYELDSTKLPEKAEGTMTKDLIEVIYYYKYKTGVNVKYVDKITGEEIVPSVVITGYVGDDYKTEKKEYDKDKEETLPFKDYDLVEEPTNKTGTMTKEPITVIYYYIHNSAGVVVKHIDIKTNKEIATQDKINGHEGDDYTTNKKDIEGYDLVTERYPANATGKMKKEETEVKYYYIKKGEVTVKYIDKITGKELTDDVVIKGHEGDNYETEKKEFDGYTLVEVPENAKGTIEKEDKTVTYYYVHNSAGVKVNHYDIITGEKLAEEEKIEGQEGDSYETKEKEIEEYDLVKESYPENAKGKMKIEETKVNYYYIHKAKVIVKYKDKNTGEKIEKEETIEGHEKENYETEEKKIENYDIEKELYPKNSKGTMTKEDIEVIYYYKRKAKVITKHIDKETGEEIENKEETKGYVGEEYKTNKKDIKNYILIEEPKNKEGKMTQEDIEVIYYYRKAIFNLSIDKKVKEIRANGETKKINKDMAKVEVHRKKVKDTEIKVVYVIKVTNDGEIDGKAIIEENIPEGMIMLEEDNKEWDIKENRATITTKGIKPGESVEYTVVLTWRNSSENFGTKKNVVNIVEAKNDAGFKEKDTKDNTDDAQFIISVSTIGETAVRSVGIATIVLSAIGICIAVVKRRTKE